MFRIKLHLSEEAPCNVVKDMELIFTSLKMPYNKKNDVYTITDENEVSVLYPALPAHCTDGIPGSAAAGFLWLFHSASVFPPTLILND